MCAKKNTYRHFDESRIVQKMPLLRQSGETFSARGQNLFEAKDFHSVVHAADESEAAACSRLFCALPVAHDVEHSFDAALFREIVKRDCFTPAVRLNNCRLSKGSEQSKTINQASRQTFS